MILNHAQLNPQKYIRILSLDAEKAFDNVNMSWLFSILTHMGFKGGKLKLKYAIPNYQ